MKYFRVSPFVFLIVCAILLAPSAFAQAVPEPAGWYAGDMHVHRSCGGSPESVSSMFSRMSPNNLSAVSLLADMGNGEVQNATTDLPLVNGKDDPISTSGRILHWDAEWHWDATYSQYAHQALGGHIVGLGLSDASQVWRESTYSILDWAHQRKGIAGFAHMQYLDSGFPTTLSCCTPVEYPVEVALGTSDFISEDVDDVNSGFSMNPESFTKAYYRLLNSGFRPGFAAGTDYPCNSSRDLGSLLTYVQVAGGQMTYRNWIEGIAKGRTVVSRNGHNEFLNLTVNGTAMPGDEIQLANSGNVQVTVQWTATQNLSGTIELLQNGVVVASQPASVTSGGPVTLTATVNFSKSGWLAARRMGTSGEHYVHTAAVFVTVNNAPVRASATDAQFFVDWMDGLLQNTSPGGPWNWYFPTSLSAAQARYQSAKALFQQVVSEANGTAPTLTSITVTPGNQTIATGAAQSFVATGNYSNGTSLNLTGQTKWNSSNLTVASINLRGLASGTNPGTTTISASLSGVTGSTTLTVSMNPLVTTTQSLTGGIMGVPYAATLAASGGTQPYTWSIATGSLPAGLSLNSGTGDITGTPTAIGAFSFTVQATDSSIPLQAATAPLNIVITSSGGGSCPCSIWPSTASPGMADSGPDSAVELGVKFRSDINGYITGIRFYKGVGNIGTHVGNLWNSAGTRLATVTFTGETTTGWQQANFTSPVAITANTTYIASYLAPNGHYSDDYGFFAASGTDNAPLHALQDGADGGNGVYSYGSSSNFPTSTWQSSNYWVDAIFTPTGTTPPPTVVAASPSNGATGTSIGTPVRAVFSQPMSSSTITTGTFVLSDPSSNQVAATVAYASATSTATLTPTVELTPFTTYTATVKGGAAGVQDFNGHVMTSDFTWSFTTGAAPPGFGPGGPILVIASVANPFTRYYSEILGAEGLNEYTVADIATVDSALLSNYDLVILGETPLTSAQVTTLSNWVTGGGRLIAMRPDKQLATLLGLTSSNSILSNAYILVQNATGPGAGIVGQTIQFHGTADLYTLNGASVVATLFSTAGTTANSPAVTLVNAGAGQAAAFTYDLARSVVYTRQGNPAWSGQKRDGQIPPIRSDDLYFGAASFDPQPDWVNLGKVSIPQADEQQRLLANLILQMNAGNKPLPRFWYLPSGFKAAVVMTGDDHGNDGTAGRFDTYVADSTSGCSVADWQCVRATSYMYPYTPMSSAQASSYVAQGFEVALHVTTDCSDWNPATLEDYYATQLTEFAAAFPSLQAPRTNRTHCISWSDYDTQPQVELRHGIRLDTNYYFWPPTWINDRPGFFTGSGIPMRFTDRNGNLIDTYQATTQMTDESGQSFPFTIDSLLDNAVGPQGYYGVFTANMHNDSVDSSGSDAIIASAQARGVPVVSAQQMLTWLDGRNSSSFGAQSWNGSILAFTITTGVGARNLQAMVPTSSTGGALTAIKLNGTPIAFSTQTIKGIQYAFFSATTGAYQAVYGGGGGTATLAAVSVNPSSVPGGTSSTGTVTLSGPAPAGGATVALSSNNNAVAQTPLSVVVAGGNTSANFNITTSTVGINTDVTIAASFGATQTTTLTVTAVASTVSLASLALSPSSVVGGNSSTGTVTLTAAAPTGGAVVTLASDSASALVPANVTVASGTISTTFLVTTSAVGTSTLANISGTYGTTKSAALTVNPPQLSSLTLNPTSVLGGASSTGTVTLNGTAPSGGAVVALSSSDASAQVPATVTVASGSTSATFTVTTSAVAANAIVSISGSYGVGQAATLTVNAATLSSVTLNPTTVVGGSNSTGTVTLNGTAPTGGATVTLQSNNTAAAQTPLSVIVPGGSISATFTVTTSAVLTNTSAVVTGTYGGSQSATLTVTAPATLSSLRLSPTSLVGGNNSTGTVTLNVAAPAGGALVTLQSSNTSVAQAPLSVTVPAGSTSATFTVTTSPTSTNTTSAISGTYGTTRSATLTVNAPSFSSLNFSSTTVVGGNNSTGTVSLNGAAPPGGALLTLQSSNISVAQVPTSVMILAGANRATFTVTTSGVGASATSSISAIYGTTTRSRTITVTVATFSSLILNPTSVTGGTSSTGTLTLNGAAPPSGAVISLSSSRTTVAQVPVTATIPGGSRSTTFTVTTNPVTVRTTSTISGTYRGTTRNATLTVR